uniref:TPT domain-containing protein n=1 Tax=Heterorhabditis bacteriophora TaxID=37862 RepID=A0A1I7WMQ4_HETBA
MAREIDALQATELMYMHSFNSLIVFLIADIVQDEIRDAFMYMMTSAHPLFTGVFIILLLSGIIFQYATFLCLEHNGALNTQLISNVRAAIQIFLAYNMSLYLFYDVSPNVFNYFGLLASIGAAYYYYKNSNSKDEEITQKNTWMKKA